MGPPPQPPNVATAGDGVPKEIVKQALAAASGIMDDEHSAGSSSEQIDQAVPQVKEPEAETATAPAHAEKADVTEVPPPAFGQSYSELDLEQNGLNTLASVADDGRVNINIKQRSRKLSSLLVPALRSQLDLQLQPEPQEPPQGYLPPFLTGEPGKPRPPPLNIVIQVVGSRGDVQPFVALGLTLKNAYGHRVRLATHPTFKKFVEENGLDFFSIGGDPAELMAFMVKNPGLMPGFETLRSGDVGKRRKAMYEMFKGCWRSCYEAGDGMGVQPGDDYAEDYSSFDSGISVSSNSAARPFVADAIIANPPSFAHIHCAEKMGIPLHLMFTMPWSPTQAFPHPLANIQSSNADSSLTNFISYALVEMLTWQGLGDVINRFRENSLRLEPVSVMWAPGMVTRLRIPHTYCWSPALIPKPKDWGPHISISGFYFLSLASTYTPTPDLAAFLSAGPPPVYIGFGSIVVDDPNAMTAMIFDAVKKAGVRALVSKGWGGLGADELGVPPGVFMLGNVPHDWLFKHVSCVVHHGGAGTTAAGIATGKPTVVVPFFGDQPFWGAMVAKAGAGPIPIPYKNLTSDSLATAILEALKPSALDRACDLGSKIAKEQGSDVGATSFHDKLDFGILRCSLAPSRTAVWRVKRTNIRLSALGATVLGNEGLLSFDDLKLYRPCEYDTEDGPWDPITGGASALLGTIGSLMMGVADFPVEIIKALKPKSGDEHDGDTTASIVSPSPSVPNSKADSLLEHYPTSGSRSSLSLKSGVEQDQDDTIPVSDQGVTTSGEVQRSSSLSAIPSSGLSDRASPAPSSTSSGNVRSSMAQVMSGKLCRSDSGSKRSGSPSRHHRHNSDCSAGPAAQATIGAAIGAGKSVSRIVGAGLKSPMDFTLGLARGFHNAPRLYGDTVRPAERVTGFQSGLKAAGKEFGYGFYDGISGLVTQPLKGAKDEGVTGLVKGIGRGIGGIVLKPGAAVWGLPGYTFKGIYKELQKHFGSSVQSYIIAARTAQGYEDWKTSTEDERLEIIHRWNYIQTERKSNKKGHMTLEERIKEGEEKFAERRRKTFDYKKQDDEKKPKKKGTFKKDLHDFFDWSNSGIRHAQTFPTTSSPPSKEIENALFEEAIGASVNATSRGDQAEDRLIERAIRASVSELKSAREAQLTEQEALERAIRASVSEAGRDVKGAGTSEQEASASRRFIDPTTLQQSLQQSLRDFKFHAQSTIAAGHDDSAVGTDDDETVREVIGRPSSEVGPSTQITNEASTPGDDEDLKKAVEESEKLHKEITEEEERAKIEDQILLNHIKKQSLREEEYRRSRQSGARN